MSARRPALRKNASLAALATHARRMERRQQREVLGWSEAARTRLLRSDERSKYDFVRAHWFDLKVLADHLCRLAGIEDEEVRS